MMKHIIITKTDINGAEINSVDLRDLHKTLDIKTKFHDWAKRELELFIEGEDYIKASQKREASKTGQSTIEYIITLETAKHISMMQKNKKGMEVRKYFIKVEKQSNKNSNLQLDIQFQRIEALTDFARSTREVIHNHDNRLENLEKNQKIEHWQQKSLTDAKNKIVYSLGGEDQKLIRKLHSRVWSLFKKKFYIPRYVELPSYKYEDGLSFIENMTMGDLL